MNHRILCGVAAAALALAVLPSQPGSAQPAHPPAVSPDLAAGPVAKTFPVLNPDADAYQVAGNPSGTFTIQSYQAVQVGDSRTYEPTRAWVYTEANRLIELTPGDGKAVEVTGISPSGAVIGMDPSTGIATQWHENTGVASVYPHHGRPTAVGRLGDTILDTGSGIEYCERRSGNFSCAAIPLLTNARFVGSGSTVIGSDANGVMSTWSPPIPPAAPPQPKPVGSPANYLAWATSGTSWLPTESTFQAASVSLSDPGGWPTAAGSWDNTTGFHQYGPFPGYTGLVLADRSVNSSGDIAGHISNTVQDAPGMAFATSHGTLRTYSPGGRYTISQGIDDHGNVLVTDSVNPKYGPTEARSVIWDPAGGITPINNTAGGSNVSPFGINGPGQVAGVMDDSNLEGHPFLWSPTTGTTLITVPGSTTGSIPVSAFADTGEMAGTADGDKGQFPWIVDWPTPAGYVAIGDASTTGWSAKTCIPDTSQQSGCRGANGVERPYPNVITPYAGVTTPWTWLFAQDRYGSWSKAVHMGSWGATIKSTVNAARDGFNPDNPFEPQILTAQRAGSLVTVQLGLGDMNPTDFKGWGFQYATGQALSHADDYITGINGDLDYLFTSLDQAKANGAKVLIVLAYQPYDDSRSCRTLNGIFDVITNKLNDALRTRAAAHGFKIVDPNPGFGYHGAGSDDPYVFGTHCDMGRAMTNATADWMAGTTAGVADHNYEFDPNPNSHGSEQISVAVKAAESSNP